MQLPQSMFRIRTNAGVLCKQRIAPELVIYFVGEHEWMFSTKSVARFVSKLKFKERKGGEKKKVLKCCPRFPFAPSKQRGYMEARRGQLRQTLTQACLSGEIMC